MFGYPLPLVPEKWRKAAQGTVDLLKQDSSVAAFGAINEKVKDTDEANKTVRGASLRELEEFFKEKDSKKLYAGLRRVGDPNDGTAVWTCLEGDKFEQALTGRTNQWRAENGTSEAERSLGAKTGSVRGEVDARNGPVQGVVAPNINGDAVPDPTPSVQGQNAAINEELLKALTKANGGTTTAGTCNNSCHCAIA